MATSVAESRTPSTAAVDPDLHPALAWIKARQRLLTYVVGAVVLVGLFAWYLGESGRRKALQATDALDQARAVMDTGNYPEASTQLERITRVYRGTDAAYEAALALNQVRMLSGQSALAVGELEAFIATDPPARYKAAAQMHLGMAHENTGKPADAAAAYQAAARTAPAAYAQIDALLAAARSHKTAGDTAAAQQVLRDIIARFPAEQAGVVEAKVRLAELTGGPI